MKKPLLIIPLLLLAACTYSQQLSQVIFSGGATVSSISFITDQKVIIRISENGKVLEWGTDPGPGRYNYYSGQLQPYMARVDYYGPEADSVMRGKVKSIGTCSFSYYNSMETAEKKGKVKMIGSVLLDYYATYENLANQGKLKSAGYTLFDYYASFENEMFRGKLKSLGSTAITYYSSFDDKIVKGKIKSIGSFNYVWYTSHDSYPGGLKSGQMIQNINGVTYILR
jgi:hypothetical protein